MNKKILILTSTIVALQGLAMAQGLTEQDAVLAALKDNPGIQISFIRDTINALGLASAEAQWLPQVGLTSTSSYTQSGGGLLSTQDKAQVDQAIPGGGSASASVTYNGARDLDPASSSDDQTYAVTLTQPLLKGAWTFGQPGYSLRIARVDRKQFSLEQKKTLASNLSGIRTQYWTSYESKIRLAIARNARDFAASELDRERVRFTVGNSAPVDTLDALLILLNAQQELLKSEGDFDQSLNSFSRALKMNKISVILPDSAEISLDELTDPDGFIRQVEAYDPDLQIFAVLKTKLELELAKRRNDLLPSAAVQAKYNYYSRNASPSLYDNAVYSLILSYSLPTLSGRIARSQAAMNLRANALDEADRRIALHDRMTELAITWKREKEKLVINQTSVEVSQKKLAAASKGHELGTVDRLSLAKAQNDYVVAAINLIGQQISLKKLEIMLDEVSGRVFNRFGVNIE